MQIGGALLRDTDICCSQEVPNQLAARSMQQPMPRPQPHERQVTHRRRILWARRAHKQQRECMANTAAKEATCQVKYVEHSVGTTVWMVGARRARTCSTASTAMQASRQSTAARQPSLLGWAGAPITRPDAPDSLFVGGL